MKEQLHHQPQQSVDMLVKRYDTEVHAQTTAVLPFRFDQEAMRKTFHTEAPVDVYNITQPFPDNGRFYIAGRTEARDSEDSKVMFYQYDNGEYQLDYQKPVFALQDPFVTHIEGDLVLGGVSLLGKNDDGDWQFVTKFYKGPDIDALSLFAIGPLQEKDIRLVDLGNRVGITRRPQGDIGGKGRIGYQEIDCLDDLNKKFREPVTRSELLPISIPNDEWMGANQLHLLPEGTIGVLGHIAQKDAQGDRHYYPIAFRLDPQSKDCSPLQLLAKSEEFAIGPAKRLDLHDVIFPGGILPASNNYATLYCGLRDAYAGAKLIKNPF